MSPLLGTPSPLFAQSSRSTSPLSGRTFGSVDELGKTLNAYRDQVTSRYRSAFTGDGTAGKVSVDDLKALIKEQFPGYTWSADKAPAVQRGKNVLHIDDANLKKMADDPEYRARVFGLMDTELQGTSSFRMRSPLGETTTSRITGFVFSIDDDNPIDDGVPYVGTSVGEGSVDTGDGAADTPSLLDALPKTKTEAGKLGSADWFRAWMEKALRNAASGQGDSPRTPTGSTGNAVDLLL